MKKRGQNVLTSLDSNLKNGMKGSKACPNISRGIKTQGFVTCISNFHKLVLSVLRSYYKKLPPKNILYRNVKRFEKPTFFRDLDSTLVQGELYNNCQEPYKKLTQIFLKY